MLRFRSVRGNHWIQIDPTRHKTVKEAKSVIVSQLPGTDISKLKLVFRGRLLLDNDNLSLMNVTPGEYVVYQPLGSYGTLPPPKVEKREPVEAPPPNNSLQELVDMEFPEDRAAAALRATRGDLERALELMLEPEGEQLVFSELEVVRKRIIEDPNCFVGEMKRLLGDHQGTSPEDERIRDGITNHIEEFLASMWLNPRALPIDELKKAQTEEQREPEIEEDDDGDYDLPEMVEKANQIKDMGFDVNDAALALRMTGFDVNRAVNRLISPGLKDEDRQTDREVLRQTLLACPQAQVDIVKQHVLATDASIREQFEDLNAFFKSIGLNPAKFRIQEIQKEIQAELRTSAAQTGGARPGGSWSDAGPMPQGGFGAGPTPGGFPGMSQGGFGPGPMPQGGPGARPMSGGFPGMPQAGFGAGPTPQGGPSLSGSFPGMPQGGPGAGPMPQGGPGARPMSGGFPGMPQAGFGQGPMPQGGPGAGSWGNSRR